MDFNLNDDLGLIIGYIFVVILILIIGLVSVHNFFNYENFNNKLSYEDNLTDTEVVDFNYSVKDEYLLLPEFSICIDSRGDFDLGCTDMIFLKLAEEKLDIDICYMVSNSTVFYDECYEKVVLKMSVENNDILVCDLFSEDFLVNSCYDNFFNNFFKDNDYDYSQICSCFDVSDENMNGEFENVDIDVINDDDFYRLNADLCDEVLSGNFEAFCEGEK